MKQTAVEWLKYLYDNQGEYEEFIMDDQWKEALEMEKEQMIDFARNIIIDATCSVEGYVTTEKDIDHYYLETYGGKDKL
jgi:hypothetical protein